MVKGAGPRKTATITGFIERFLEASVSAKKGRQDRESAMRLFNDYLANYGEVASNVEKAPLVVTAPISQLRPGHFRMFVSWFIIRKVADRDKSHYVPVLRDFVKWLVDSKAVGQAVSKEMLESLDELRGEPERCEKLAELLYQFARRDMPTFEDLRRDPKAYAKKAAVLKAIHHEKPKEVLDGYFTVSRVGPSALWLNAEGEDCEPGESPASEIGPVQVPAEAAELFRVGDRLSVAIGRMSGFWKLLETGGVYPD